MGAYIMCLYFFKYISKVEAAPRFELGIKELQSCALPLGYAATFFIGVNNGNRTHDLQSHNLAL